MDTTPVPEPMLTNILVDAIHEANVAEGKRPKAFDTMFRHSDAGKCARQIAFGHLGFDETEPMDLAGHWVTWLGKLLHEHWQKAAEEKYGPDCEVEVKVRFGDLTSGHLDALIVIVVNGVKICFELKSRGVTGFDKAAGFYRQKWVRKEPQGPTMNDLLQGSLNALASNAELLIIGIMGTECLSKGFAEKVGASDLDRFMAEWHYTREEFEPLALAELDRLGEIKAWIDRGDLPPRWGLNDKGYSTTLDPQGDGWECGYCPYRSLCIEAGPFARIGDLRGLKEEADAVQ
jgi:hypothetical protein